MSTPSAANKPPAIRLIVTKAFAPTIVQTGYLYQKNGVWTVGVEEGPALTFEFLFKHPLVTGFRLEDVHDGMTADDVLDLCRADALDDVTFEIFSGPRRDADDLFETAARAQGWDLRFSDDGTPYFIAVTDPDAGLISSVQNGDWQALCERDGITPALTGAAYAALKKAEPVCDDAFHDAQLELDKAAGADAHDRQVLAQNRDFAAAALHAVRAVIAQVEGRP